MKLMLLFSIFTFSGLFLLLDAFPQNAALNHKFSFPTTTPQPDLVLESVQKRIAEMNCKTVGYQSSCHKELSDLHVKEYCVRNIDKIMLEVCPNGCNNPKMTFHFLKSPVCMFKAFHLRKDLCCGEEKQDNTQKL